MRKFILYLAVFLLTAINGFGQVLPKADFAYLKRVFYQPQSWQTLEFEKNVYRYLEHRPCVQKSDSLRFFLGYYFYKQKKLPAANYYFSYVVFTSRNNRLIARAKQFLREMPAPLFADSSNRKNFSTCEQALFAWLQWTHQKLNAKFKPLFLWDARIFLRHFPDSQKAPVVSGFILPPGSKKSAH